VARVGAELEQRPGRAWRPLADTAVAAQLLYGAPDAWSSYRRGTDFYNEGWLLWLDVDTLIRQETKGRRSLDDFCRAFLGGTAGPPGVKTYTLDDVVQALNGVHPYDWRAFLTSRVSSTGQSPLGGIERGGYRLAFSDVRNQYLEDLEDGEAELTDVAFSIGLRLNEEGEVQDAVPGTPAYDAGIAPGMKVIAVNGRRYSSDVLRDALLPTSAAPATLTLLVENNDFFTQHSFSYRGGLREPHLERDASKPALLDQIIAPR
jgi:predicted metalloprotease with PDZ domain